mmetsp:Transcript_53587/g.117156  ORF Transcript_53587/g.117156 Transcript_53587/m.117156 type:complete len:268 (-) Transcript_53587:661-1464(-)
MSGFKRCRTYPFTSQVLVLAFDLHPNTFQLMAFQFVTAAHPLASLRCPWTWPWLPRTSTEMRLQVMRPKSLLAALVWTRSHFCLAKSQFTAQEQLVSPHLELEGRPADAHGTVHQSCTRHMPRAGHQSRCQLLQAVGVPVEPQAARALRRRGLGVILQLQDHRQVEAAHSASGGTVPCLAAGALAGHRTGVHTLHWYGRPLGHCIHRSRHVLHFRICHRPHDVQRIGTYVFHLPDRLGLRIHAGIGASTFQLLSVHRNSTMAHGQWH